jgi:hypothetical protein
MGIPSEDQMTLLSTHRKLALAGALFASLTLAGAAAAGPPPKSSHASSTAVTHAAGAGSESDTDNDTDTNNDHGNTVSAAAQSSLTGGPHNNHGGYVSCVARGGSNCTSLHPTLPSHGDSGTNEPDESPAH